MLDFSTTEKSQIGQEFSSENDFEPRFSISLHCGTVEKHSKHLNYDSVAKFELPRYELTVGSRLGQPC